MNNKGKRIPKACIIKKDKVDIKATHEILKDNRVLNNYLKDYKELPTKLVIRDIDIKSFGVNIFKVIENSYLFDEEMREDIEILFVHKDGAINRCRTYDISYITKEMV